VRWRARGHTGRYRQVPCSVPAAGNPSRSDTLTRERNEYHVQNNHLVVMWPLVLTRKPTHGRWSANGRPRREGAKRNDGVENPVTVTVAGFRCCCNGGACYCTGMCMSICPIITVGMAIEPTRPSTRKMIINQNSAFTAVEFGGGGGP